MALIQQEAPRRAETACEKHTPWTDHIKHWFNMLRPLRRPHVRDLKDHHLRDIGLTRADIEAERHRNPSQHTYHPRS